MKSNAQKAALVLLLILLIGIPVKNVFRSQDSFNKAAKRNADLLPNRAEEVITVPNSIGTMFQFNLNSLNESEVKKLVFSVSDLKSGMDLVEVSENIEKFVSSKPILITETDQNAEANYLFFVGKLAIPGKTKEKEIVYFLPKDGGVLKELPGANSKSLKETKSLEVSRAKSLFPVSSSLLELIKSDPSKLDTTLAISVESIEKVGAGYKATVKLQKEISGDLLIAWGIEKAAKENNNSKKLRSVSGSRQSSIKWLGSVATQLVYNKNVGSPNSSPSSELAALVAATPSASPTPKDCTYETSKQACLDCCKQYPEGSTSRAICEIACGARFPSSSGASTSSSSSSIPGPVRTPTRTPATQPSCLELYQSSLRACRACCFGRYGWDPNPLSLSSCNTSCGLTTGP